MKKEYIKPVSETIHIGCESVLALSVDKGTAITEDNKSDFVMQGRDDDSHSSPNVWDQGW